ncbi:PREDICTED: ATP-dependent RNA helicase DDX19A-like isoform X2 [Acropora digitifera]|uniref:ATP-dependent RNA helicase DDX19A-like isoform X2 n=1 Tax=Acropora digitifera TaxID=70779 RepID=UPI000779FB08|nr:PREDICTED: ATP-dependent RNA helicase DDX19A-like isoform X2 [Acropora digitifera]
MQAPMTAGSLLRDPRYQGDGSRSIELHFVFLQTRKSASWLATKMTAEGHSVALLSGEITVEQRLAVLNRFRDGKEKLLITTNVCARGIDVEQVTVVVNYDMPVEPSGKPDFETYLYRIGRTGRFGKNGIAVNFIADPRSMNIMKKIEEHFGKKISALEMSDVKELEKLKDCRLDFPLKAAQEKSPINSSPDVAPEASYLAKVLRNKLVQTKNGVEVRTAAARCL